MKKQLLLLSATAAILFFYTGNAQNVIKVVKKEKSPHGVIVIFKSTLGTPLINETFGLAGNRKERQDKLDKKRKSIKSNVYKFAFNNIKSDAFKQTVETVNGKTKTVTDTVIKVFADMFVGFSVNKISATSKQKLQNNPDLLVFDDNGMTLLGDPEFQSTPIYQELSPESTPIFQKTPIFQSTPIFQDDNSIQKTPIFQGTDVDPNDPVWSELELDPTTRETVAVQKAGNHKDWNGDTTNAIWFLDTGVDPFHPDLNVDQNLSISLAEGEEGLVMDFNGHGTHCAGITAAKFDNVGVTGVAAGARIISVKILDSTGNGSWSTLIRGLDYVAQYGMPGDVVNMSLGDFDPAYTENTMPVLTQAIKALAAKGILISMSAGNSFSPAKFNLPGLINGDNIFTTAALTHDTATLTDIFDFRYSNFNTDLNNPVDFVTTGTHILSTWAGKNPNTNQYVPAYRIMSGTSMASAVTAGVLFNKKGVTTGGQTVPDQNNLKYNVGKWSSGDAKRK